MIKQILPTSTRRNIIYANNEENMSVDIGAQTKGRKF